MAANNSAVVRFAGPTKQDFETISEQAKSFLDEYYPNWNNYRHPKGYIIPPVFNYKNPEVSGEAIKNNRVARLTKAEGPTTRADKEDIAQLKRENCNMSDLSASKKAEECPNPILTSRESDEAEYLVYEAIQAMHDDDTIAPFIAIHNLTFKLNIDKSWKIHGPLVDIFPNVNWDNFHRMMNSPNAEFDFVLIGQKIGLIGIEVKSSNFGNQKHFVHGHKHLPVSFRKGLLQLERLHALNYFLNECTGVAMPEYAIRKILFVPNLQQSTFDSWMDSLNKRPEDREHVENMTSAATVFFQEDLSRRNTTKPEPPFYNALKAFLKRPNPICQDVYEHHALIIAAIASMVSFPEKNCTGQCISQQHMLLQNQNFRSCKKSGHISPDSLIKSAPKNVKERLHVMFLSPDQLEALKSQEKRQIIIGAAGTGKTIILQAKAIEWLSKGTNVTVLATKNYMRKYEELFQCCGFDEPNYKIYNLAENGVPNTADFQKRVSHYPVTADEIVNAISNLVRDVSETPDLILRHSKWFLKSGCTIIDDSFDIGENEAWPETSALTPLIVMAMMAKFSPQNSVIIAMDPCPRYDIPHRYGIYTNQLMMDLLLNDWKDQDRLREWCSITLLKTIMRCSEHIFNAAYASNDKHWNQNATPRLGHKILGMPIIKFETACPTIQEAERMVCFEIKRALACVRSFKLNYDDFAILTGQLRTDGSSDIDVCLREFCAQYLPECKLARVNESCEAKTPQTDVVGPISQNKLVLDSWNAVSSFEWKGIIYVACIPSKMEFPDSEIVKYQRYRAISRATTIVIEITVNYDADDMNLETDARRVNFYPGSDGCERNDHDNKDSLKPKETRNKTLGKLVNFEFTPSLLFKYLLPLILRIRRVQITSARNLKTHSGTKPIFELGTKYEHDFYEAYNQRGIALALHGKYAESVVAYDLALKYKEDFAEAHYNKGIALHELSRYNEAIAAFDLSIKYSPHSALACNTKGIMFHQVGKFAEAMAAFNEAIKIEPDYIESYINKAVSLQKLGLYKEAEIVYDQTRKLKNSNSKRC